MSFLIQPAALRTETATREWKMMHGGADKHAARYLKRDKSQPLLRLTGAAGVYLSQKYMYITYVHILLFRT